MSPLSAAVVAGAPTRTAHFDRLWNAALAREGAAAVSRVHLAAACPDLARDPAALGRLVAGLDVAHAEVSRWARPRPGCSRLNRHPRTTSHG